MREGLVVLFGANFFTSFGFTTSTGIRIAAGHIP
ncbi:uncharacterized protein METZ01_LOCUS78667 [marine metagenome]|uniref:Uncharacterized protein n=1 Tax=marine metagenome TaxID=408172 RepID=A0A381UGI9_9ZZZZ